MTNFGETGTKKGGMPIVGTWIRDLLLVVFKQLHVYIKFMLIGELLCNRVVMVIETPHYHLQLAWTLDHNTYCNALLVLLEQSTHH